jgi:UDP-glucuronate decarboxylase
MADLHPVVAADVDALLDHDLPWEQLRGATVLVTGASGMLPSYVVHTLLRLNDRHDAGVTVLGLVRNESKARAILAPYLDRPDFRLVVQDVAAPVPLDGALDLVVHGASAARPSLHNADPVGTMRANVLGTMCLLDLAVEKGARFALMSSAEVYGLQPESTELIDENSYGGFDILSPRACYSEGKRAAETLCAAYGHQHGVVCRIGRFGHIYGPGMALDDGRVQAEFAAKVLACEDIVLNSDGSATRTYTYVADAMAGFFYALLLGQDVVYNIADPDGLVSIRQLAEVFAAARPDAGIGVTVKVADTTGMYSAAKAQGLSSARLRELGWRPSVSLAEGVSRMLASHETG